MSEVTDRTYRSDSGTGRVSSEDYGGALNPETAGKAIDRYVRVFMRESGEKNYQAAFKAVWPLVPPRLQDAYAGLGHGSVDLEQISDKLARLAEQIDALDRILRS